MWRKQMFSKLSTEIIFQTILWEDVLHSQQALRALLYECIMGISSKRGGTSIISVDF